MYESQTRPKCRVGIFYGNIQGFEYEPGYQYTLKVKQFDVANPPADAPNVRYELVEIINKAK